tara:strand:- start:522 stop:716 length:195 start_codon:yes stop_codon:yes gene_type:complete
MGKLRFEGLGLMDDYEYQQPESDDALEFWMWCEEQMELEQSDICPKCGKQGGEYTPTLDECAFC